VVIRKDYLKLSDINRKLATIRTVSSKEPIEGADRIELIRVDGWQCIAQKGLYEVGSKVVYCEIDSFLPVRPEFEWLRKSSFKSTTNLGDGFRIRTMKMKGVISQGLLLPIEEIPELMNPELTDFHVTNGNIPDFPEMFDVTEILGIQKYEKPIPSNLHGKVRGNFPSFIPKTDQERYQNIRKYDLEKRIFEPFEVSVKMDGASMTAYMYNGNFGVCSRNLDLLEETPEEMAEKENSYWKAARKYDLRNVLSNLGNVALQGELCGPGIQNNPHKLKELMFFIYDIYDIDMKRYFSPFERHTYMSVLQNQISHVPVSHVGVLGENLMDRDYILKMAEESNFNDLPAEGIVFKANDGKFSFKMISPKYLLENDD
jgi:RNA ligase (TIGR02306 family)